MFISFYLSATPVPTKLSHAFVTNMPFVLLQFQIPHFTRHRLV